MPSQREDIFVDSMSGGNGDIWMRLASFYSAAALMPSLRMHLLIPKFLRGLAQVAFGDRLCISDKAHPSRRQLTFTSLGIKDLLPGIAKGKRYVSPYQRAVVQDKKEQHLKDWLNVKIFDVCDYLGWVGVPKWEYTTAYQGFLEMAGIKEFKHLSYQDFVSQLEADYPVVFERLNGSIPVSRELTVPQDIHQNVVVFPTGTSRQFVPVSWAKRYLPDAYYAFFYKDKDVEVFNSEGLKTILFYQEPGDIITLSKQAKWTISTDSFPSHLLQYSSKDCTITITEVLSSRIISPVFKGHVVDSEVDCHPCLHLDKNNHPLCAAGFKECRNWLNSIYIHNILRSIPV